MSNTRSEPSSSSGRPRRALLLGREHCEHSRALHERLLHRGLDVEAIFSSTSVTRAEVARVRCWNGDFIVAFRSRLIVPREVIERSEIAMNIHPGTPEYPGLGCTNWALYDGASEYGATAHLMAAKVDSGSILRVVRFPVSRDISLPELLRRTHEAAFRLAGEMIDGVVGGGRDFIQSCLADSSDEAWSGLMRGMEPIERLQRVDPFGISAEELTRVVRSTHTEEYPVKLNLHGYTFRLESVAPDER